MNNNTILRMSVFFIAAALLVTMTTSVTMVPAAYAGGDDDGDKNDNGDRKYAERDYDRDGDNGDGNNQKVQEESAGILADCDKNEATNIYICSAITPVCRPGAVCVFGEPDPALLALPTSWR